MAADSSLSRAVLPATGDLSIEAHDASGIRPPASTHSVPAIRCTATATIDESVEVAEEVPVALVFNGISHAVMMATPEDLEDFALGFALSEGIIDSVAACRDIEVHANALGIEVHLAIGAAEFARLKDRRRSLAGRTGCGLCGMESLAALDLLAQPVDRPDWSRALSLATVLGAMAAMPAHQPINARTGATHAAAWVSSNGAIIKVMEDIGRHNALDKLIGWLAQERDKQQPVDGFVAMSSRASYELVRKCTRLNIPALAAISAPSGLAIKLAEQSGMGLLAFCRPKGMTVFAR
jgi:FdhD protein